MKKLSYLLSTGVLFVLLTIIGCGSDDGGPSEEETQTALLNGTWTATSVTTDGSRRTDYDGFTITFTDGNYTTSGGPDLLPFSNSESWDFGSPVTSSITLGSQSMNYAVTNEALTLSFAYTGEGFNNARTAEVEGAWVFTFER
ncbi:hypothetical protein LVD15_02160 [Fulvivirga maritima]|uniref:hypothetical protein n=1 Tax=Fulvivirga maritima TaxID=2904247 RepID=UPI001F267AD0|nr:hypothetical protein [Fulvivirga maritima]UII27255.1 hypothetical protein LVD15_02160 [Fulvivirga maritima]